MTELSHKKVNRPVVYDYKSISEFLRAVMDYNKVKSKHYSIRRSIAEVEGCSTSLVSQVLNNKRRLTRDQLPAFAHVFILNDTEIEYIDEQLKVLPKKIKTEDFNDKKSEKTSNHILKDWIHIYVKDTCELKSFKLDAKRVHRLLGGIAPVKRIQKSMDYLLHEGFWKKGLGEEIKVNEYAIQTTSDIPNKKIRSFHKRALDLVKRGLDVYPTDKRFVSTQLVSVNQEAKEELNLIMRRFQKDIQDFMKKHPEGDEELLQINLCMTPIGGVSND